MKSKIWIFIAVLAAAAMLIVGIWKAVPAEETGQLPESKEEIAEPQEESKDIEKELPVILEEDMSVEEPFESSEAPTQMPQTSSEAETELREEWETLTQQFSEMGELELPEDVF